MRGTHERFFQDKRNKKKGLRNIVNGKIVKKYRLLRYTGSQLIANRRPLSRTTTKEVLVAQKERQKNTDLGVIRLARTQNFPKN